VSDVIATGVVVCLTLALVSLMLVTRLAAGGANRQRTSMLIAELWLTVGVIAGLFIALGDVLGPPGASGSLGAELDDLGRRFAALGGESKALAVGGGVLALGLFAHLVWAIGRAMRQAPPP
jgi:hypothetical protein